MHFQRRYENDFSWPRSAEEFMLELRKPDSPYQRQINAAENDAAFKKLIIDILFWQDSINQQKSDLLLEELIEEQRIHRSEKFPDILATAIYPRNYDVALASENHTSINQTNKLIQEIKILETQLHILNNKYHIAREEYIDAREKMIDAMVEKAQTIPLLDIDGNTVNVREVLENPPFILDVFQTFIESILENVSDTKNQIETGVSSLLDTLSKPDEQHNETILNTVLLKNQTMDHLRLIMHRNKPEDEDTQVETSAPAKTLLEQLKRSESAIQNMWTVRPHADEKLKHACGLMADINITAHTIKTLKNQLDPIPEISLRFTK